MAIANSRRAEDGRRRHQRRGRRRAHRRPRACCGSSSATGSRRSRHAVERMFDHGEAVVRSYFEKLPDGRYVGHGVMDDDGISDEPIPFEVVLEVDGSTVRLDYSQRARRARRGRSTARSRRPSRRAASRSTMLAGGGECAERGPLPADRGRHAAGLDVPPAAAGAVLPLRLAGDAGDRGDLQRGRRGACRRRSRACSGGDICALVWWGVREDDRRALGRRLAAPGRPGRARSTATARAALHAPRRGGDALLAARGVGGEEPVADRSAASSRPTRAGPGGTAAGSASTWPSAASRTRSSSRRSSGRRTRRGGSRAAARRGRTPASCGCRTEP